MARLFKQANLAFGDDAAVAAVLRTPGHFDLTWQRLCLKQGTYALPKLLRFIARSLTTEKL